MVDTSNKQYMVDLIIPFETPHEVRSGRLAGLTIPGLPSPTPSEEP